MEMKVNWEERRWMTASIILAAMHANSGTYDISYRAEDAVNTADALIKILADPTRPSICAELYQRTSPLHADPTTEGCIEGALD